MGGICSQEESRTRSPCDFGEHSDYLGSLSWLLNIVLKNFYKRLDMVVLAFNLWKAKERISVSLKPTWPM